MRLSVPTKRVLVARFGLKISRTASSGDRKSTRLNSSHTEIYTLSLHDALPISRAEVVEVAEDAIECTDKTSVGCQIWTENIANRQQRRSEEHTSELQSHRDLHSFPTRRSSDLSRRGRRSC